MKQIAYLFIFILLIAGTAAVIIPKDNYDFKNFYNMTNVNNLTTDGIKVFGNTDSYDFNINQVPDPATAPTGVVSAGGSVDTGTHRYYVTYTTATGETHASPQSATITTTAGQNTVTLTIPVSTDPRVTGRKIFRSKAGQTNWFQEYYLDEVTNNVDTTYVDTTADADLGDYQTAINRIDSTTDFIKVAGERALVIDTKGVWMGIGAGESTTTGGNNVLIGYDAGTALTNGGSNTYVGNTAGDSQTGGNLNTGIGYAALAGITSASDNVAIGGYSLFAATGTGNTAIGKSALQMIVGAGNTGLGYFAGAYYGSGTDSLSSGDYNIFIGWKARAQANDDDNEIVIGKDVVGLGSNTVLIGNDDTTMTALRGNLNITKNITTEENLIISNGTAGVTQWNFYSDANGTLVWEKL